MGIHPGFAEVRTKVLASFYVVVVGPPSIELRLFALHERVFFCHLINDDTCAFEVFRNNFVFGIQQFCEQVNPDWVKTALRAIPPPKFIKSYLSFA